MTDKSLIRAEIRAAKKAVPFYSKAQRSDAIMRRIEDLEFFRNATTVLFYWSLPDEVQTHDFIELWSKSKRIILPCVEGENLVLRQYLGRDNMRTDNKYGISEPTGDVFERLDMIDFALVPGMAFDRQCNRLGRGRGFYDRLLASLPHTYKAGAAFDFQLLPYIPTVLHDIKMDAVVAECETIRR